jgi:hypothetical protein
MECVLPDKLLCRKNFLTWEHSRAAFCENQESLMLAAEKTAANEEKIVLSLE